MNAQQVTILGLVVVLIGIGTWTLVSGGSGDANGTDGASVAQAARLRAENRDPTTWSLAALPAISKPVRAFTTDGGVRVVVLEEGRGESVRLGNSMDLRYTGYLLDGTSFEDGILRHVVMGQRDRYIVGLQEGLQDMRPFERRRILIPNELAYGAKQTSRVPAYADIVFDLRWIKLVITDLKEGTGVEAREGSEVTVRYRGMLEDGTVFEETGPGDPSVTFTLKRGGLIDGWVFGLTGMKVGGERRLWIPAHMAYKETRGPTRSLPPWSNLIFIIELVDVQ